MSKEASNKQSRERLKTLESIIIRNSKKKQKVGKLRNWKERLKLNKINF
jgi:hypothetical protein